MGSSWHRFHDLLGFANQPNHRRTEWTKNPEKRKGVWRGILLSVPGRLCPLTTDEVGNVSRTQIARTVLICDGQVVNLGERTHESKFINLI